MLLKQINYLLFPFLGLALDVGQRDLLVLEDDFLQADFAEVKIVFFGFLNDCSQLFKVVSRFRFEFDWEL